MLLPLSRHSAHRITRKLADTESLAGKFIVDPAVPAAAVKMVWVSLNFEGGFKRSAQHRLETYQLES
jgi:hypothetical protein